MNIYKTTYPVLTTCTCSLQNRMLIYKIDDFQIGRDEKGQCSFFGSSSTKVRPSLQKKMQHDHLKFYSHGSSGIGSQQIGSFQLGGSGVVPILIGGQGGNGRPSGADSQKARSTVEKHIEIVEYLKKLPDSSWVSRTHLTCTFPLKLTNSQHSHFFFQATYVDIQKGTHISLI